MPAALIISSGAIMSPAEICQLQLNPPKAPVKRLLELIHPQQHLLEAVEARLNLPEAFGARIRHCKLGSCMLQEPEALVKEPEALVNLPEEHDARPTRRSGL